MTTAPKTITHPDHEVTYGEVVLLTGGLELTDITPVVRLLPGQLVHLGSWRFRFGGVHAEDPAEEAGLHQGYAQPGHDDEGWIRTARINAVPGGLPTWEGDSYEGYGWYRTRFTVSEGMTGPAQLDLGSPVDGRSLEWSVFLDGQLINEAPLTGATVSMNLGAELLGAGPHLLAVRERIAPTNISGDRATEREGWRRLDPFCQQSLAFGPGFTEIRFDSEQIGRPGVITMTERTGQWRAEIEYVSRPDGWVKHTRLHHTGSSAITISDVDLASLASSGPVEVHHEGAWGGLDETVLLAGIDPAAVVVAQGGRLTCRTWLGLTLEPGAFVDLPPVVIARDTSGFRTCVTRLLSEFGRPLADVRIYDPYGWCQISHASEPKIELDDDLMGQVDAVMGELSDVGVSFDYLALDTGWNDPDDLSSFHPGNFPDGPQTVLDAVARHGAALMLWVSPNSGPRAFRHELGLQNPGLEECMTSADGRAGSLCPAAEPWASRFRSDLLSLIDTYAVRGFKIDGTELFCQAGQHGHVPGIWSIYATSRAMITTLTALAAAGADYTMLYWGLRSPWWLRWASTLWDRGYLVEAAAPSARPGWTQRGSVMVSQDIGQVLDWDQVPPHQQDSLGVWLSDTAWASHLATDRWDDAIVMDLARGSRALQLWGDLRPLVQPDAAARLTTLLDTCTRRMPLGAAGRPFGTASSGSEAYGYLWRSVAGVWVVLSQPGDASTTTIGREVLGIGTDGAVTIDYLSLGSSAAATLGENGLSVELSGGTVVAAFVLNTALSDTAVSATAGRDLSTGTSRLQQISDERAEVTDPSLLGAAYIGRTPSLADWGLGPVAAPIFDPTMPDRTPPLDRYPIGRRLSYRGEADVAADGELAVIITVTRDGGAWKNDHLHDITTVTLTIDDVPAITQDFPTFKHEQAGSWSWIRRVAPITKGTHRVDVEVTALLPDNVACHTALWLR